MARTKQPPRKSTQSTASSVEPQKTAAKETSVKKAQVKKGRVKKTSVTEAAAKKALVQKTPTKAMAADTASPKKRAVAESSTMAVPPSTPPPPYSTQSDPQMEAPLNNVPASIADQQNASDSGSMAVPQQQQPSASAAVKRKPDADLSPNNSGPFVSQLQGPASKKFKIDFMTEVKISLGNHVYTVPKNLIQARSKYVAAKIKELNDSTSTTVHVVLPDTWSGGLGHYLFGAYLQLLFTGEVVLPGCDGKEHLIPGELVYLLILVEHLEDLVAIKHIAQMVLQDLRRDEKPPSPDWVQHICWCSNRTTSVLRAMMVDHVIEVGSTPLPEDYPAEFVEDLANELMKRQRNLTGNVFEEDVPVEEAVKKYAALY